MNTHEQHEIYEKARKSVQQKKKVYIHFIFFIIGAAFLIFVNKVLNLGTEKWGNWYQWMVTIWFFLWLYHVIHVFIINRFFGKEWERSETEKLIIKHQEKLNILAQKLLKSNTISSSEDDLNA